MEISICLSLLFHISWYSCFSFLSNPCSPQYNDLHFHFFLQTNRIFNYTDLRCPPSYQPFSWAKFSVNLPMGWCALRNLSKADKIGMGFYKCNCTFKTLSLLSWKRRKCCCWEYFSPHCTCISTTVSERDHISLDPRAVWNSFSCSSLAVPSPPGCPPFSIPCRDLSDTMPNIFPSHHTNGKVKWIGFDLSLPLTTAAFLQLTFLGDYCT